MSGEDYQALDQEEPERRSAEDELQNDMLSFQKYVTQLMKLSTEVGDPTSRKNLKQIVVSCEEKIKKISSKIKRIENSGNLTGSASKTLQKIKKQFHGYLEQSKEILLDINQREKKMMNLINKSQQNAQSSSNISSSSPKNLSDPSKQQIQMIITESEQKAPELPLDPEDFEKRKLLELQQMQESKKEKKFVLRASDANYLETEKEIALETRHDLEELKAKTDILNQVIIEISQQVDLTSEKLDRQQSLVHKAKINVKETIDNTALANNMQKKSTFLGVILIFVLIEGLLFITLMLVYLLFQPF